MKAYKISAIDKGTSLHPDLVEELRWAYLDRDRAVKTMNDMGSKWDPEMGPMQELYIHEIEISDFSVELGEVEESDSDSIGGWVNGTVTLNGRLFDLGGGWIHSEESARENNNSMGIQPDLHPDMDWPGAWHSGDFEAYGYADMGDVREFADFLKIRDLDDLTEVLQKKTFEAWKRAQKATA